MKPTRRRAAIAFLFAALAVLFLLGNFRHAGNDDMVPTVLTTESLLRHGSFWLDDFEPTLRARRNSGELPNLAEVDGRYITPYATGAALAALPIFALEHLLFAPYPGSGMDEVDHFLRLGRTASACWALVAVVALCGALKRWYGRRVAFWGALTYAVGTPLWYLSQALWQHVPFQALVCVAFWLVASAPGRGKEALPPGRLFLVGLALGAAGACRYQNAVLLIPLALALAWKSRGWRALAFMVGGALPALFVAWFHNHHFGSPIRQGLTMGHFAFNFPPWLGAASLLFNPSFGLIVTAPILFLLALRSFPSAGRGIRRQVSLLGVISAGCLFTLLCFYNGWFGGYSYSSRMIADATPCLIVAVAPGIRRVICGSLPIRVFAIVALAFGALINAIGVYGWDQSWNAKFDKGLGDQRWAWAVQNNMPLYYLRRGAFLVPALTAKGLDARVVRLWIPSEEKRGWNAAENWGGTVVRWSRLESRERRRAGSQVRYLVGHKDLENASLVIRVVDDGGRELHRNEPKAPGEFTFTLPADKDYTLTWEVSRQQEAPGDSRVLGVAVFDAVDVEE